MQQTLLSPQLPRTNLLYAVPETNFEKFCNAYAFKELVGGSTKSLGQIQYDSNAEWAKWRDASNIEDVIKSWLSLRPKVARTGQSLFRVTLEMSSESLSTLDSSPTPDSSTPDSSTPDSFTPYIINTKRTPNLPNTPMQDKLRREISELEERLKQIDKTILTLATLQGTENTISSLRNDYKKCLSLLTSASKKLTRCKVNQKASQNYRDRRKSITSVRTVGRPRKYPISYVVSNIESIVSGNSEIEAQDRRRSEKAESEFQVWKLRDSLAERNIHYSNSAVYNHLLPKRKNSIEGSRHIIGGTVHFYKPENNVV